MKRVKSRKGEIRIKDIEVCNECGRRVNRGSRLFIDRVPSFDDYKARKENNLPFPEGAYICRECEEKANSLPRGK